MRKLYATLVAMGFLLVGARAALAMVCPVTLPAHTTAIGASVELPERINALHCQGGDILAISGDVHPQSLAQVCDLARSVVLHAPTAETGRPNGALCTFVGMIRPHRMPDEAAHTAHAPENPALAQSSAPRVQAVQSTQPAQGAQAQARPLAVSPLPPAFIRTE